MLPSWTSAGKAKLERLWKLMWANISGDMRAMSSSRTYDADRQFFPLADQKRPLAKAMVDRVVKRIRAITPGEGGWKSHDGYGEIPVTAPLEPSEIAEQFPTLGFSLGDELPAQRGKLREHLAL